MHFEAIINDIYMSLARIIWRFLNDFHYLHEIVRNILQLVYLSKLLYFVSQSYSAEEDNDQKNTVSLSIRVN